MASYQRWSWTPSFVRLTSLLHFYSLLKAMTVVVSMYVLIFQVPERQ